MTYCSEPELLCNSICAAKRLTEIIGINAAIINPEEIKFDTKCDICKEEDELLQITRLLDRLDGKIIFYSPKGEIFIATPIIYEKKTAALFVAGPLADEDIKNLWDIFKFVCTYAAGISPEKYFGVEESGYFEELENSLIMDIRRKNIVDFKEKTHRMLYNVSLRMSEGIFSLKALALMVLALFAKMSVDNQLDLKSIFGQNFEVLLELKNAKYESVAEDILKSVIEKFTVAAFGKATARQLAITDAVNYIENHFKEKLTLDIVANEIYMSPHYLSKAFSRETGIKFSDFLNITRIERAKKLLENDKLDLKEIAQAVGIPDQSYFSKVFKKITGLTPKQYKIRIMVSL